MMRTAILGISLLLLLGGCSPSDSDPAASEELLAAAEATLALDSFHMESRLDQSAPGEADYNAPDRARRESVGSPDPNGGPPGPNVVTISVGDSGWTSARRPGYYWKLPGGSVEDVLFPLVILRTATEVSGSEGDFTFTVDRGDGLMIEGEASVTDGLVTSVVLHDRDTVAGSPMQLTYGFSQFDSAPRVEAPPANRVIEESKPPDCPDEPETSTPGEIVICTDVGPPAA